MIETGLAELYLYGRLHGDATLLGLATGGVHRGVAPEGQPMPYVVYSYHGGAGGSGAGDVEAVGAIRVMVVAPYVVKAVGLNTDGNLQGIADRIDALLHDTVGTVTGGRVLACARDDVVQYLETKNGVNYRHLGGIYVLSVQET